MSMVRDSVREIQEACEKMITDAECLNARVDVFYNSKVLQSALRELTTEFDKDTVMDDVKIKALKANCESEAITLEYCLALSNVEYRRRYRDRCFVNDAFAVYSNKIRQLRERKDVSAISNQLANYRVLEHIVGESKHLLFELDADSRALLADVRLRCTTYDA